MYIVNTSFMVDHSVSARWMELLTKHHIPFLREHGLDRIVLTRVISIEASDHFTYSLQVGIADMEQYRLITEELFQEYVDISVPLFGDKVQWFTSLMKHVDY